jgi:hypothetical protein
MTFAFIRAGLPNSIVMLALAMVPIVTLAMASGETSRLAGAQSSAVAMVAGPAGETVAE